MSNKAVLNRLLNDFYPYAKEYLGFDKDADVYFVSDADNGSKPLGKTAYYDPSKREISVYTDNRHPKDIMRSISHELVHHAQNCRGDLGMSEHTGQGYAQNDEHLREMEREAYEKGNLCFRDWEDGIKSNLQPGTIYESRARRSKNSMNNYKTLSENFKAYLKQENQAGSYQAGDKVKDLRNDTVGTVVEPMAGGAVIELEDGTIVKTRDKFLEKVEGEPMQEERGEYVPRSPAPKPDVELIEKIAELMASDPEFKMLSRYSDQFKQKAGRNPESALEAILPDYVSGGLIRKVIDAAKESLGRPAEPVKRRTDPPIGGESDYQESINKIDKIVAAALKEYGDHETQAQGGMVSSTQSSDPELDQVADIAATVAEQGGALMQIATALKDQAFDTSLQAGVLMVDNKYFIGKPDKFDISPDEQVQEAGPYVVGSMGGQMEESQQKCEKCGEAQHEGKCKSKPVQEAEMSKKDFVNQAWEKAGATSRDISDEEAGTVESFNNWLNDKDSPDYHLRQQTWEPAQSYRGGRVLAWNRKEGKYLDVAKDMYLDDDEVSAILPENKGNKKMKLREKVVASVMATLKEGNFAEYGKIDAEDGNPPSKIGQGDPAYMEAYNAVLVARGEEPLPVVQPDQAYLDALQSGSMKPEDHSYNKKGMQEMYDDDDAYGDEDPYMADLMAEFPWLAGDEAARKAGADDMRAMQAAERDAAADPEMIAQAQAALDDMAQSSEDDDDPVVTMKEEEGWMPQQSRDDVEYGGKIHLIPGVKFTGDIESDLAPLPPEILDWMYGELDSADSIEDESGHQYAGGDVQDVIQVLDWEDRRVSEENKNNMETTRMNDVDFATTLRGRVVKRLQELSKGQEELDLDDDGKIEPEDLAGLRAGKEDEDVGEEAKEKNESLRDRVYRIVQKTLHEIDGFGNYDDEDGGYLDPTKGGGARERFAEEMVSQMQKKAVNMEDNGTNVVVTFEDGTMAAIGMFLDDDPDVKGGLKAKAHLQKPYTEDPAEAAAILDSQQGEQAMQEEGKYKKEADDADDDKGDKEEMEEGKYKKEADGETCPECKESMSNCKCPDEKVDEGKYKKEADDADADKDKEEELKEMNCDDEEEDDKKAKYSRESDGAATNSEPKTEQIANDPQDFFRKLRNESRNVTREDWNKNHKSKRSSMLNERLMKSWFNK